MPSCTLIEPVAQRIEQFPSKEEVAGSIPAGLAILRSDKSELRNGMPFNNVLHSSKVAKDGQKHLVLNGVYCNLIILKNCIQK